MNAIKNTPETKNGIFSPTIILIKVYSMKTVPAYAKQGHVPSSNIPRTVNHKLNRQQPPVANR